MNREKLLFITVILLACAFVMSVGILFYYISHAEDLTVSVQRSVKQELEKYNLPTGELSVDDSKVILAIARYCSIDDNCKGDQGIAGLGPQGVQGTIGPQGVQGIIGEAGKNGFAGTNGLSIEGPTGPEGPQGIQGEPGIPAKTERRCNNNRIEWRNEGDESWQVEYNLAAGQTCSTGG